MQTPTLEELYVVSDLHLGGSQGAPIFRQEAQLAGLIGHLATRTPPGQGTLGLVLNGDVIDTLAEKISGYVATPDEAEEALGRIVTQFPSIWQALAKFVDAAQHRLVLVIGNHDIELAYPNVQQAIVTLLAKGDEVRRGRIDFVTSGVGYRCEVARAGSTPVRVLCVHGNEFDSWNAVSPESMNRLVRAGVLGTDSALTAEPPNAGTMLVKDVMNDVKAEWPFVDLLKPELESVFNVLFALDPQRVSALEGVFGVFRRVATEGQYRTRRLLGGPSSDAEGAVPVVGPWQPGKELAQMMGEKRGALSLEEAWNANDDVTPEELAAEIEVLGAGQLVVNSLKYLAQRLRDVPRDEALRAALLDWGGGQDVWSPDGPCDIYDRFIELDMDAHVVIAGHTHLRRQKRLPARGRAARRPLYLNTGTWARLMRLTKERLATKAAFAEVWAALSKKTMAALDALEKDVLNQPTVAVVRGAPNGNGTVAALCEFQLEAGTDGERFVVVPDKTWEPIAPI
jgi:UDP-2,3-diacylglucosamine pyrophosphatase LpxH